MGNEEWGGQKELIQTFRGEGAECQDTACSWMNGELKNLARYCRGLTPTANDIDERAFWGKMETGG
jgi:hypothetical protein